MYDFAKKQYLLASFLQYGAYNPENAGTKYISPTSLAASAISPLSLIFFTIFKFSFSHLIAIPRT